MCSESGAYGGHEEYMMSHDDYEQDMDDYNDMENHIDTDYDHDMGDFDHGYDDSCMEDMADHRYYEHDMVDHHHYEHGDELYTDYTSASIIDEAEHHTNYDNFDSMSTDPLLQLRHRKLG